ncbi:MAG: hypothetical protein WC433_01990 [Candidatus Omnitrophota bacterium]
MEQEKDIIEKAELTLLALDRSARYVREKAWRVKDTPEGMRLWAADFVLKNLRKDLIRKLDCFRDGFINSID